MVEALGVCRGRTKPLALSVPPNHAEEPQGAASPMGRAQRPGGSRVFWWEPCFSAPRPPASRCCPGTGLLRLRVRNVHLNNKQRPGPDQGPCLSWERRWWPGWAQGCSTEGVRSACPAPSSPRVLGQERPPPTPQLHSHPDGSGPLLPAGRWVGAQQPPQITPFHAPAAPRQCARVPAPCPAIHWAPGAG